MSFSPRWALDEMQYNLGVVTVMDCCGNLYITDDDEREISFWDIIYEDVNRGFDKVVNNEAFGKKDNCVAQN